MQCRFALAHLPLIVYREPLSEPRLASENSSPYDNPRPARAVVRRQNSTKGWGEKRSHPVSAEAIFGPQWSH